MENNSYRIGELAEKAGVTKRTVHYYISRGLLPPPEGAGLATTYSDEHLYRIMLIKKMQDEYLPLDEIRRRIRSIALADVMKAIESGDVTAAEESNGSYSEGSNTGNTYERIELGLGIELHYPSECSMKARRIVDKIVKYSERIFKEE